MGKKSGKITIPNIRSCYFHPITHDGFESSFHLLYIRRSSDVLIVDRSVESCSLFF